ncbi:unnamed protein product [Parnassius apollo]|uniref:(apollo) hypothetical protein n=1 Tax=Parnassius apollo TaxID=110799 RepID=A0A8S3Y0Y2_PARAO|nr:unnamed protein product [Parnassius apollo]
MILLSVFIIFLNGFVMLTLAEPPSSNNGQQWLTEQYGEVPEVNNLLKRKSVESSLKNLKVTNHASNEISTNGKTITNTSRTEVLNEIPEVLFSDLPHHRKLLLLLLQNFQRGNHLLLVENRGLENKKVAGRLLQHLNRFTEYTQLHSATSIESLTVEPSVKNGTVIYEDSPLVRAVKYGYVLVVDEANKAPTTVTSALNTLIERREMLLSDGRMMIPKEIMTSSRNKSAGFIPVHEDFRMIIMASQTGFPFFKKDSSDLEARDVRRASVLPPPGNLSRRRRFVASSRNGEIGVTVKAVGSSPKIITTVMGGHSTGPYAATAVATGTAVATATALTYDKGSSTATATASGSSVANAIAYSRDSGVATATVTTSGSSVGDAIADAYNTGGATATITCTGSSNSGAIARAQDSGVATATATTSASASLNVRAMARGNEVITDTKTKP